MIYWLGWVVARTLIEFFGRFRVEGCEHVPRRGPVILAANHVSMLDPPAIGCSLRRSAWFMGKEELFSRPFIGWLLRRLHAFPVRRGAGDRAAMKKSLRVLSDGGALAIFPEGTRHEAGEFGAPELGVGMLALRTGAPVVPVFISGTDKMLPKGARFFRFARVRIRYGEPIVHPPPADKPGHEAYAAVAGEIMAAIRRLGSS